MCARAAALAALVSASGAVPALGQGIPVTVGVGAVSSGAAQFDLPVVADMSARSEKLGSFVLTLRWNPAVLQFQGGVDGTFGSLVVNQDSASVGVLKLSGVNPAGVSGLVTLGVGRFQVLVNDTTTFRVAVQELYAAGTFADLTSAAVPLDRLYCGSLSGRYGDLNRDGSVNAADALIVLTESVGLDVSQYAVGFGDVDNNGVRNPRDALIILSYAVGLNTASFRVGQVVSGAVCQPPGAQSYGLNPVAVQAIIGQEVSYFAFGLDSSGAALALRNVTWASSNAAVASVDGGGLATALTAGTTTITALQNDTTVASGTLTVVSGRRTHWVDALASQARNQLGTVALPFGTLQDAIDVVAPGDTLRVRSGRYEGARIDRSLAIIGDTSAGGTRPRVVISDTSTVKDTVFSIVSTANRVLLQDLVVDTAKAGIEAYGVDTLELAGVDVRVAASGYAAVVVDSSRLVRLLRTRLFGVPAAGAAQGLFVTSSGTVALDSSLASDFSNNGVYAYDVDSIDVRRSTLQFNGYAGLWVAAPDTASASRLVFSRNRVTQNASYGVYASYIRQGLFDHNVFVGAGYYGDGVYAYGTRAAVLSLLADSLDVRQSNWLYATTFDSVRVDSVVTVSTDYGGDIYDFRTVLVTNSRFQTAYYDALYFGGRSADSSTVVVQNSQFSGFTNLGYYDGYGLSTYDAALDVQNTAFNDLYSAIEVNYGRLALAHSSILRSYYGVDTYCLQGSSRVDSTTINAGYYGLYLYGCSSDSASVAIDSLSGDGGYNGVWAYLLSAVRIRQSRLQNMQNSIYVSSVDTVSVDTSLVSAQYSTMDLESDTLVTVTGNTVTCSQSGADGVLVYDDRRALIRQNAVSGPCDAGIYAQSTDTADVRANTVSANGSYGIYSWVSSAGEQHAIVGNAISGSYYYGGIRLDGVSTANVGAAVRVDSNTVTGGTEAGISFWRGDTVRVRDNVVTGVKSGTCCISVDGGIVFGNAGTVTGLVQVLRNRISGSVRGIVLQRYIYDSLTVVQVDTNRIVGSDSAGIFVGDYTWIVARNNMVDSSLGDGVRVDRSPAGTGDDTLRVIFTNNSFTRSAQYGVNYLDGGLIDARGNWWGDANGPGNLETTGDVASSGVLYDNWLTTPPTLLPPAPPPFGTFAAAAMVAPTVRAPAATATAVPQLREPHAGPPMPGADVPPERAARIEAQRRRQEERIQRYRLQVERRQAQEAARAARTPVRPTGGGR
jgi:hypothetical protein